MKKKIIVAVTGASGSIYADVLLKRLIDLKEQIETCGVVFTETAKQVWDYELGNNSYNQLPFNHYNNDDFFAPIASGSAGYDTMIVCPCSVGTMGRIASGTGDNLLTRAADVILKERKKLILVVREMPYSLIHIENMKTITLAGGIICPASPSYYSKPTSDLEIIQTVVDKILQLADFKIDTYSWGS